MRFKTVLANLTLANQLTFLRLVAVPFFVLAVLNAKFGVALALFIGAAVTDILDGLMARVFHQSTPLGTYLDPAADKLLTVSALILLTSYPAMFRDIPMAARVPVWLTILAISRDVFIVSVSLMMYLAYNVTRFPPTIYGKVTTLAELITVSLFLLFNMLGRNHLVLDSAVWVTLALIVISGLHYLWRTGAKVHAEGPDTSANE